MSSEQDWRKASKSLKDTACIELKPSGGRLLIRDSKDPAGPVLRYTEKEWSAFLDGAKNGEFDDIAGLL